MPLDTQRPEASHPRDICLTGWFAHTGAGSSGHASGYLWWNESTIGPDQPPGRRPGRRGRCLPVWRVGVVSG